jgi:FkbM family methyltransferase
MSRLDVTSVSNLPSWLTMVAQIYPPKHVVLVGAGNGTGLLVQWLLNHASQSTEAGQCAVAVTLLEPHAPSMAQLAKRLAAEVQCANWQFQSDTLIPTGGDSTYHQFSLAAENGLLPLEALRPLWPGLQLQSQQLTSGVSLESLVPASWLLIDCLPVAQLLEGTPLPATTQVVLARVVLANAAINGSSLTEVQAVLEPYGFRALAIFEERNSTMGKVLFVRDPSGLQEHVDQLKQEKQQIQKSCDELTKAKELETLAKQAEVQARAAEQQAKERALAQLQQLKQEKQQIQKSCDELTKAKELETLAKQAEVQARAAEQQAKERALAQLQQLKQEKQQIQKSSVSDDDIDEFIEDLSLFFYGRFIVYVDVGAYIGEVFKKLFDSKKVKIREAHLFEPNPESYAGLKKAVEGNHSMHAHNLAIGKQECTVRLISSKTMTKVIDSQAKQGLGDVFDAQCVSLDSQRDLFTDRKINLLKIDVEGYEQDVLEGATHLLESQSVDMIYIEVGFNKQGTQQTYFGRIDATLQAFGYRAFKIYEQKNEWINDSPLLRRINLAYMSQKFADANPSSLIRKMRAMEQELQQIKSVRTA